MTEELEGRYPFKVTFDPDFDWLGLTFRLEFKKNLANNERKDLESSINSWADKGIDEGYGEGKMHDLDPDFEWVGKSLEFFADMGTSDEKAVDELLAKLSRYGFIVQVKIGFGEN